VLFEHMFVFFLLGVENLAAPVVVLAQNELA
jgi:hypothetical protein